MSESKKLIPRRRFREFEKSKEFCQVEWHKLVERLTVMSSAHCLPRVEFEDIISGQGELNKDVFKKINDKKGVEFKKGDILFGKLRPYLKNWLYAGFDGIAVGDFWVFRPTFSNGEFIYALIQTNQYQIVANQSTGTKMPRSDWNIVSNTKFIVTTNKIEQTQIGEFFKKLDNLINTQQKKLEKTKILKSAYLTEMFPNKGELKPKRHFLSFKYNWKEFKIKELFTITRGKVLASNQVSMNRTYLYQYPVYSSQTKNNGLMGYYKEFLFENAITWTTDGANAGTVNYRENKFYSTNVNGVLLSSDGFANKAIAEMLNTIAWKYVSKVGNPKLMSVVMAEIPILIPNIEEQIKIGNFFKLFDDKIALEQKKLDKLKNIKQAYLNEMFV
jgi:type I restriction enzyme, S subunit